MFCSRAVAASRQPDSDVLNHRYQGGLKRGIWVGEAFVDSPEISTMSKFASPRLQRLKLWISYSITVAFVAILAASALGALALELWCQRSIEKYGNLVGSIVLVLFVGVAEESYLMLANVLTRFENHRTMAQFDRHLGFKTVLFQFFLANSAPYFVAFFKDRVLFDFFAFLTRKQYGNFVQVCDVALQSCCVNGSCFAELEFLLIKLTISKAVANMLKTYFAPLISGLIGSGIKTKSLSETTKLLKDSKSFQTAAFLKPFQGTLLLYHYLGEE